VGSILDELQKKEGVTGFIYMSDHADDVNTESYHMSNFFTYEMTQIPLIIWFSKAYKEKYSDEVNNLLRNAGKLYSNDMLYDTLAGIFNIETDKYDARYNYASEKYQLDPKDALVLREYNFNPNESLVDIPKRHYTEASNYIYWQKENEKLLKALNQSSRVIPDRVNTIGKLRDIWNDGIRSFQLNAVLSGANGATLYTGYGPDAVGVGLEKYFSSIDSSQIKRVFMVCDNMNENNYRKVLRHLVSLDDKHNLKNKLTIISDANSKIFKEFKEPGWHISYRISDKKGEELLREKSKDNKIEELIAKLADKIQKRKPESILFDYRLYPLINQYLQPLIAGTVSYCVQSKISLRNVELENELLKNPIFLDGRVEALFVSYQSHYKL
jgi:hypothetical protein